MLKRGCPGVLFNMQDSPGVVRLKFPRMLGFQTNNSSLISNLHVLFVSKSPLPLDSI